MADVWIAARRPLLVAFVTGCAVSLMTSGRITARLAGPATVYWTFIPFLGIVGLAALVRGKINARMIDEYFRGYAPWLWWLTAFAAVWAFVPPADAFGRTGYPWIWEVAAVAAALWSGWLDFRFSRHSLKRSPGAAVRDVLVQRLVVWTGALVIFVSPAAVQVAASKLGL